MCLGTHYRQQAPSRKAIEQSLINPAALKPDVQQQHNEESLLQDVDMIPVAFEQHRTKQPHRRSKTCKGTHAHIIVHHNYHDHCHDPVTGQQTHEQHPARGGVTTPFPLKLHSMLDGVKQKGNEDIVSWAPHGRCIIIHKPKEFVSLLPRYFKLSKLASFQRQLNLYGFQRLTKGKDRGGYYHEYFLRGKVFLAHKIQRLKVKGTGVRARSNPAEEPNFWKMEWMDETGVPSGIPSLSHERDGAGTRNPHDVPSTASPQNVTSSFVYPESLQSPTMLSSTFVPIVSPSSVPRCQVKPVSSAGIPHDEDTVCAFDRTFHYMDPFQPISLQDAKPKAAIKDTLATVPVPVPSSTAEAETEAEVFFKDFEFPDCLGADIEDDAVFGEILASLIA